MPSSQVAIEQNTPPTFSARDVPGIRLPPGFGIQAADPNLHAKSNLSHRAAGQPTLTPQQKFGDALVALDGAFTGPGFNTIFRPSNEKTPVKGLPASFLVLELNLTHESWNFSTDDLGTIPNRGFADQRDIDLFGKAYTQRVRDVTDNTTGLRISTDRTGQFVQTSRSTSNRPRDIHFEPGLFISVPATDTSPKMGRSICRMASIPHGTTINAQGTITPTKSATPNITPVSTDPFHISGVGRPPDFGTRNIDDKTTARLPQDLSLFNKEGTITSEFIDNPNALLIEHNKGKAFLKTIEFQVSTALPTQQFNPRRDALELLEQLSTFAQKNPSASIDQSKLQNTIIQLRTNSGNTSNIAFLDGSIQGSANASASQVSSKFWISTIAYKIEITTEWQPKKIDGKDDVLRLTPTGFRPGQAQTLPTFAFPVDRVIKPQTVTVQAVQVQYSQTVMLTFNGTSWPHVSVATLVPLGDVRVPAELVK